MIPEFPQAPSRAPRATAGQTSDGPAAGGSDSTASAAAISVRYRLVPVSASGTGKTFSASIAALAWARASTLRRHQCLTVSPSRTSAAILAG